MFSELEAFNLGNLDVKAGSAGFKSYNWLAPLSWVIEWTPKSSPKLRSKLTPTSRLWRQLTLTACEKAGKSAEKLKLLPFPVSRNSKHTNWTAWIARNKSKKGKACFLLNCEENCWRKKRTTSASTEKALLDCKIKELSETKSWNV